MDTLSDKITCSMCQLPLADTPKVLPGCLHVFCLPCLKRLPIAFVTTDDSGKKFPPLSKCPDPNKVTDKPELCSGAIEDHFGSGICPPATSARHSLLEVLESASLQKDSPCLTPSRKNTSSSNSDEQNTSNISPYVIHTVSCPKCKRKSSLPTSGFEGLQTSYVISNMAATYKAVRALESKLPDMDCEQCVDKTTATSYCSSCRQFICEDHSRCHKMWKEFMAHKLFPVSSLSVERDGQWDSNMIKLLTPSLRLGDVKCTRHLLKSDNQYKFFCSTCEDLACIYCTVSIHEDSPDHTCVSIMPEVISKKRNSVVKSLEQFNLLVDQLDSLAGNLETQRDLVNKKASQVKDRVEAIFSEIVDTLHSRKLSLLDKVDELSSDPLKKLKARSKKVDTLREHVLESRNFVQENLNSGGDLGLLSVAGVFSSHSSDLEQECRDLKPECKVEIPVIEFMENRDHLYDSVAAFGNICINQSSSGSPEICTRTPSLFLKLQQLKLPLSQQSSQESTTDVFNANLMDSLTGTYAYPPPILHPSDDTPSPVVINSPRVGGIHVRTLEGLDKPSGIRVDGSFKLIVCEFGTNRVTTFDQSGTEVGKIGNSGDKNGHFLFPQNSACDIDGRMLVVDSCYRIQMFDKNGKFLKSVGSKGKGPLQFMDPVSIAISPDKRVFVCERENHRIQVLKADLSFLHFIGKKGRKECEFYLPNDIAISESGHLYVADSSNHRIQILTLDGTFVSSFGKKGPELGQLNQPSHICIDSDGVFITEEGNHRVSIFNLNGFFIRSIGQKGSAVGRFNRPLGVAIDKNKSLYVCDCKNNRIQIFK